jgi:hypothetical protein
MMVMVPYVVVRKVGRKVPPPINQCSFGLGLRNGKQPDKVEMAGKSLAGKRLSLSRDSNPANEMAD